MENKYTCGEKVIVEFPTVQLRLNDCKVVNVNEIGGFYFYDVHSLMKIGDCRVKDIFLTNIDQEFVKGKESWTEL